jgi:hypothetical protein
MGVGAGAPGDASDTPPVQRPDRMPEPGPAGPRTPYPVDDPGVARPDRPGSEPDVSPGRPLDPGTRF